MTFDRLPLGLAVAPILLLSLAASVGAQTPYAVNVAVQNRSSYPLTQVTLNALQTQLTYHYGWKYNRNVTIRQATPTSSDLAVYIDNNEANFPGDCNANRCYGVHYTSTDVAPLGTIYINAGAVITLTNGQPFNVPLTISIGHEVMEAVEDPGINRVAIAGSTACIFELVDPVEAVNANNSWFYYISAYDPVSQGYVYVPVADFVFRNFLFCPAQARLST